MRPKNMLKRAKSFGLQLQQKIADWHIHEMYANDGNGYWMYRPP